MVEIEILKGDGSSYWTMQTNTRTEMDAWISEEQTRPYWKPDFTFEITEIPDRVPTQGELDKRSTLVQKRSELSALVKSDMTNISDVKDAILKILEVLNIK